MKKQLLTLILLTLGYAATTEAKHKSNHIKNGDTVAINSKEQPTVPVGVTVTKIGKDQWSITNNSGQSVQIQRKRK